MQRKIFQIVLSLIVSLSMVMGFGASTPARASTPAQGVKPELGFDPDTGQLIFVGAAAGSPVSAAQVGALPAEGAMGFVKAYAREFGLSDPTRELVAQDVGSGDFGGTHVSRYQQVYQGVPVFGGNLVVSTTKSGALLTMQGKIRSGLSLDVNPPDQSDVRAQSTAKALVFKTYRDKYNVKVSDLSVGSATLWVYDEKLFTDSAFGPQLVWKMDVRATNGAPVNEVVLVNAQTGKVAVHYNQIDEQWTLPKNTTTPARTSSQLTAAALGTPLWSVYTAHNTFTYPRDGTYSLLCNETTPCPGTDWQAADAATFAVATYNLYAGLGRDSLDNAGMRLNNNIHLGGLPGTSDWYFNAFWDGSEMYYGEWLAVDDVVGHELSHGVTEHTSNLIYMFQPGAINESLSDVFGQFVDLTTGGDYINNCDTTPSCRWLLGEDVLGPNALGKPVSYFRNMKNPPAKGNPDKMSSPYYFKKPFDNGGVHYNSGVDNKAAYLMTDGGTFNYKTVKGLGIDKVAAIYYQAQTAHLFPSADYRDLYYALNGACSDLVGGALGITTTDCQQVLKATQAVEMNKRLSSLSGPVVNACPSGSVFGSGQFYDGFEAGTGNWTFSGTAIDESLATVPLTPSWTTIQGYQGAATNHSLYAPGPDGLNQCDDVGCTLWAAQEYAQMNAPVSIPVGQKTFLTFDHMYIFDTGLDNKGNWYYYDGGRLQYSTNGGTTWLDAKPLFNAGVNYNGTIWKSSLWFEVNPWEGLSAFVSGSRNDSLTLRYNLSSLAGQSVLLRYGVGYDYGTGLGWFIDNVDVHTCAKLPAKPVLQSPATGAIVKTTPTLNWTDVAGLTYYRLQVDDSSDFSSPVIDVNTGTTSSYIVPAATLNPATKYFWRVQSVITTEIGDSSKGWTGKFYFITKP